MPRGDNPNSRENLKRGNKKTQFTVDNAVEMQKKSAETKRANKALAASLKENCTPEAMDAMNQRIISMAKHGNLNAYKIIRDGLGENPGNKNNNDFTIENEDDGLMEAINSSAASVWETEK